MIFGGSFGDDSLDGGIGNDSIYAGAGDQSINGGAGDDTVVGSDGQETVSGGSGNDVILAGDGDSSIFGGAGNDLIFGGSGGNDSIYGGEGDDSIYGGDNNDSIYGGPGVVVAGDEVSNDIIDGGTGNDLIFGGSIGNDSIYGGEGNDSIIGATANDAIYGGDGDDTLVGGIGDSTLLGGDGNDLIFGGSMGGDSIDGGTGNDSILLAGNDETVLGGSGNDTIYSNNTANNIIDAGSGDDQIHGGTGLGSLIAGSGNDTIWSGSGDESISAGEGNDLIFGGSFGDDSIDAGDGDDSIQLAGGNDSIFAGSGNDTIITSDGTETISAGDGNDLIFGGSLGNDSIYGGEGNDTIIANSDIGQDSIDGGAGNDLIFGQVTGNATVTASILQFNANAVFHLQHIEDIKLIGDSGNNVLDASAASARVYLDGAGGNDSLIGGLGDDVLVGGSGVDYLAGGAGNDTYLFFNSQASSQTVFESANAGSDTLDFSSVMSSINLDLSSTSAQAAASNLSVQLIGDLENIIGSDFNDRLVGNDLNNILIGQGGQDTLLGGAGNDRLEAGRRRTVFLDFDSASEIGEHVYSSLERNAILTRIQADYAAFDVQFVTTRPTSGQYVTILFNAAVYLPGSQLALGGISERIGWRELSGGGIVQVDVNGFFGTQRNRLPGTVENFVALSSTIAAHELAHTYGLRHQDAFGPPGSGVFDGGKNAFRYRPVFTGPKAAFETKQHLIASPASVGTTLVDALGNPYFGERESLKLAFSETGSVVTEIPDSLKSTQLIGTQTVLVQPLGALAPLSVPNTLQAGASNFGRNLDAAASGVIGEIKYTSAGRSENDYYSFQGRKDDVVTIEVMSQSLRHRFNNTIDSLLRVYNSAGQKIAYYGSLLGAFNDDSIEPTDSILIDLVLPADDSYTIEVDTFSFQAPEFSIYQPSFNVAGYSAAFPNDPAVTDRDRGQYELLVYRFNGTTPAQTGDNLNGGAGADLLYGNSGKEVLLGFNSAEDLLFDSSGASSYQNTVPIITAIPDQTGAEGQTIQFTAVAIDPDGDFGNGWSIEPVDGYSLPAGATIDSSTGLFSASPNDNGLFAVRIVATDTTALTTSQVVYFTISNQAPTATVTHNGPVNEGSPITISLTDVNDPSSVDSQTLRYSIASSIAGLAANYGDAGIASSAVFTPTDNGTSNYYVRVFDKDGGFNEYSTTVVATNVAPTATITSNGPVDEGSEVTISLTNVNDPSSEDGLSLKYSFADSAAGLAATYATAGTSLSAVFATNDSGTKIYYARVFDKDGGFTDYSTSVFINNVAPTASITNNGPVNEGSPVTISLAGFNDPSSEDGLSLKYSFADSAAGLAATYATAGTSSSAVFATNDSGTKIYYARVFDKDGGFTDYSTSVVINNIAPTASITNNGPVNEGSPVTISLTGFNDPSSEDGLSLKYSFADSTAGLAATYATAGTSSSAVFATSDSGTKIYYARVFDKDGGFTDYSTLVVINNVAPTATITNNGPVNEGSPVTISLTGINDPSTVDGLSLKYSFADSAAGLAATYATAGTSSSAVFATSDSGTKIYYARVFDKDGGFTDYSTSVVINNVAPTASITNNGPVNEGSPVTISLTGINDPSSVDGLSLKYSFADSAAGLAATYATADTSSSAVFATNDSGTKIYYARVFDKDGGFTDYSTSVVINNIAPTAIITNNGPVNEGSPVTISLTGVNDPSSADGLAGFRYSFATSLAGLATSYATSGTATSASFANADNGTRVLYARVFDKDGGFSDYNTTVVVNNVAPTISLAVTPGTSVAAGTNVTVTSTTFDPAGTNDLLTLTWTVTKNGVAFGTASSGTTYQLLAPGAGVYVITLTANDGDGGVTQAATTVTVTAITGNVPPTVSIIAPDDNVLGQTAWFQFKATDTDAIDANGTFTYTINWGDGSAPTIVTGTRDKWVSHVYTTLSPTGQFQVTASATDGRGATGPIATSTFTVSGFKIISDPQNLGQSMLIVVGSIADDKIKLKERDDDFVRVTIRGQDNDVRVRGLADLGDVSRVLVFAFSGDDEITIDDDINLSTQIWGGQGDDKIKGGSGSDIIFGEAGDDKLYGGEGRDLLFGGLGEDKIFGDDQDDILVAGFTIYDIDDPSNFAYDRNLNLGQRRLAVEAIMAEWNSGRTYAQRIANIRGTGSATRANGNNFLIANSTLASNTVFDDNAEDKVEGDDGLDWFFVNTDGDLGTKKDKMEDRRSSETVDDIDRWF